MTFKVSVSKPNFNIVRQRALFGTARALKFLATNINKEITESMERNDKTGAVNDLKTLLLGVTYRRSAPQEALSSDSGESIKKVDYTISNPLRIVGGFKKFQTNYVRRWEKNDDIKKNKEKSLKHSKKQKIAESLEQKKARCDKKREELRFQAFRYDERNQYDRECVSEMKW